MLVIPRSTQSFAKREAGGKGYNLYLLTQAGFPVPPWVILGANLFRAFRTKAGVSEKIVTHLNALLNVAQPPAAMIESVSQRIRTDILKAPLPAPLKEEIEKAFQLFNAKPIAVRSSAMDEDSCQHSFAGQLSSFLYVRSWDDCLASVKECWASAYSARSLSYRIQHRLDLAAEIEVAVVLQEMVEAEKSGVLFTCDPIQKDPEKITVNAVYGIGEGLASGLLDADTYVLNKANLEIHSQDIANKRSMLWQKNQGSGLVEVLVGKDLAATPALDASELKVLGYLGSKIEKFYRFPQDVEWASANGRFYLLQSRSVTTQVRPYEGKLFVWDNSNIGESYGGLTLPLTFGFAHDVYHQEYVQLCEVMHVPAKEIRNMQPYLEHMLGLIYGRVYYNILNWYKLTSAILPGFIYKRSFMETMIGTPHQLSDEIANRIRLTGSSEKLSSKLRRFLSGLKFFYFHLTAQSMVDSFLVYFKRIYGEFRKIDYSRMPADEIYTFYQILEQKLLREWKAPIVNEYLCMVHFGLFKKLTGKWLSQLGPSLQNDLLCGNGNLESAEPTKELIRLARVVADNAELKDLIESTPAEDCHEALRQSAFHEFTSRVERYIDFYGHRCMSEMKLEQKDLHQDPSFLFVCLKNYLRSGQVDLAAYEARELQIRIAAEAKVLQNLKGLKLKIYSWSLKHARKAVRNRENTQFCRTRIYGVVRSMFYGIGNDFTLRGMIDKAEDVFYLELHELKGALDGTLSVQNLRPLIALRKEEYSRYETLEPAARIFTRGPVYWLNDHFEDIATQEPEVELPENCMKGLGCCPGVVEGTVKVVIDPDDDMELNGEILVTMRTDPGWIPLYPSISGLLVERGGLLSHSVIVAREMGLPTVVGIKGLVGQLKTGMRVRFDGQSGLIEILDTSIS